MKGMKSVAVAFSGEENGDARHELRLI